MILIQEESLVISLEQEDTGEGMLEFKDRYSWNTLPLQIKCCIWLKRFQLYLIAEKKNP